MSKLAEYQARFGHLIGWFSPESQAIWDSLLSFQSDSGIKGNLLEIGVFAAKSATLSTLHSKPDEKCVFIDLNLPDNIVQIIEAARSDGCEYISSPSEACNSPDFFAGRCQSFRWIHIDGEHTGMAVQNDMQIADKLLHRQGILCIDDFFGPAYPQITFAVFQYLYANPASFSLALCGFNKAYLCRPFFGPTLREYLYRSLVADLEERQAGAFTLHRTTVADDMNTFGITEYNGQRKYSGPDWAPDQVII